MWMNIRSTVALLAGYTLLALPAFTRVLPAQTSRSASGGSGAYATGNYRNLFTEAGYSDKEVHARIQAAFQQLFHGDPQSQTVYYEAGRNQNGPLAYVTDIANHDVRTEGMSYGMMIAVQTGHKSEFDALWNWANSYMLITDRKNPSLGYYAWSMHTDGTANSDSPAPDGEEYFAMSLYFAAHRWGNGTGLYDYQAQADRILHLMRHHAVLTGTPPFRLHPRGPVYDPFGAAGQKFSGEIAVGPMVNEQNKMMMFVPGMDGSSYTDPSYHLPAFFDLWAQWGPAEDRTFWAEAAETSRHFFTRVANPVTGLVPDYANFDGTPRATNFNPNSHHFSSDSWRTISNWSVDQSWWGKNPDARLLSDRLQGFLYAQGIHSFANRYTTGGKPLTSRHSAGMVATTAVGSLAAGKTAPAAAFVQELWNTPCPTGQQRYYDGLLYMMSLLHASGEFRIWMPVEATGKEPVAHGK